MDEFPVTLRRTCILLQTTYMYVQYVCFYIRFRVCSDDHREGGWQWNTRPSGQSSLQQLKHRTKRVSQYCSRYVCLVTMIMYKCCEIKQNLCTTMIQLAYNDVTTIDLRYYMLN